MHLARAIVCSLAVSFLVAPASLAADTVIPRGLSKDQLFGTMLRHSKWDRKPIEVCWENPEAVSAHYRELTRNAVATSWEAKSGVRFSGWQRCSNEDEPGLRIVIGHEQPHTRSVGLYLDRMPSGMHLNFGFQNWRPACASDPDPCARAVVVHEFGHALGFTHEQVKPGAPAECSSEPRDIIGDYLVTQFDKASVMSLCNPQWNGNGNLSSLDVQAAQRIYGA